MTKTHFTPVLIAAVALVSACTTVPKNTPLLDQTRSEYVAAINNPQVPLYAPVQLQQAGAALEKANIASNQDDSVEKIDRLAYLAKQKIALSQEVAKQKAAEMTVATASKERERIRLEQRTNEADAAKSSAADSQLIALGALNDTAEAQRKARLANNATAEAQRNAELANRDAAEAQRVTREAQVHAAQLEAQLADLAAKKTERGIVITLGDVLFSTDQSRLSPDGMRTAKKLADVLQQNPQRNVLIEGFTDSVGTAAYNQTLSERRGAAVRSALEEMGVTHDRIAVSGYGESYPVASNDSKANRQLNRRVEIVLSDTNGKIIKR